MKSKTKSSSNSTSSTNSTTTPTVAPWLSTGYQNYSDLIGKFAGTDPSSYVADANSNITGAGTAAQSLGGWQDSIKSAISGLGDTSTAGMDRSQYMNPYLNDVLNTTLADYDANSGTVRADQAAQAAANRAFGGSRYGIREAQTEGELARGRATTAANIRDRGYQQATAQMQADADRRAAALNSIGNFGNILGQGQRSDIATQLGVGQVQQGIDQAKAQALPDWLQQIGSLYGSVPIGSFTSINSAGTGTGSQQGSSSTSSISMSDIAKLAQTAAAFSDERLKENIEYVMTDDKGYNWYNYNYIWEPEDTRRLGVLAQEVKELNPDAIETTSDGFLKVRYGSLR